MGAGGEPIVIYKRQGEDPYSFSQTNYEECDAVRAMLKRGEGIIDREPFSGEAVSHE